MAIILSEHNLVLHIRNADLLDPGMTEALLNICRFFHREVEGAERHGRLFLAWSCFPGTRPVELLSRRRDEMCVIYAEPLSEQDLRRCLDRNFSSNRFTDEEVAVLHFCGRAGKEDKVAFPGRIAAVTGELLQENLLIWDDDCWRINPYRPEAVNTVIGLPLFELYRERLAAVASDLREEAERFMELAALCRQWIPQQLLLQYMGLDEERADDLLDCLDATFVETEPALLIDEEYGYPGFSDMAVYRFAFHLLADSLRPRKSGQEAENLLAFVEQRLPDNDQLAALCRQLAEQCDSVVREQYRERLAWYFVPEAAEYFTDMLLAKLNAGLVSVDYLLKKVNSEREKHATVHLFRSVISACDRWYQLQGGVPTNWDGAVFLSLFGSLLNDLGRYDEALAKKEAALAIRQRILPADHPYIASSLSYIGKTLSSLVRHEDGLTKLKAALAIQQRMLPKDHPRTAITLKRIGVALVGLGQYEEALAKMEAALVMQQ